MGDWLWRLCGQHGIQESLLIEMMALKRVSQTNRNRIFNFEFYFEWLRWQSLSFPHSRTLRFCQRKRIGKILSEITIETYCLFFFKNIQFWTGCHIRQSAPTLSLSHSMHRSQLILQCSVRKEAYIEPESTRNKKSGKQQKKKKKKKIGKTKIIYGRTLNVCTAHISPWSMTFIYHTFRSADEWIFMWI